MAGMSSVRVTLELTLPTADTESLAADLQTVMETRDDTIGVGVRGQVVLTFLGRITSARILEFRKANPC